MMQDDTGRKKSGKNIGVILLGAGASSRLGTPKQLMLYDGQTLLQHSLQVAGSSIAHPVVVVLGAHADTIKRDIDSGDAHIVVNATWQEGMASSIRYGINALVRINPFAEGAVLMVCDQPFVTASLLNDLITARQLSGNPIITCSYAGTFGPPTLFHKSIFPELLQLKGDVGARSILRQHANEVEVISFPEGSLDIDTKEDYQKLSKGNREL
jgi:molybdenum cofactor cytidylyltransferase